jgi:hypothetical protein
VVSESSTATDNYNPAGSIYNATLLTSLTASDAFFAAYLWEPVDDSQTINWQNVDNTQNPGWGDVDDQQTPGWYPVIP